MPKSYGLDLKEKSLPRGLRWVSAADLGAALGVVIAYLVAVSLGVAVKTPEGITQVRLSAGIAAGALLILRPTQRPLVAMALIAATPLASLLSGKSLIGALAHITGNVGGALLVVALMERWLPRPLTLEDFRSVVGLFAAAAFAGVFGQALVALALQATGSAAFPFLIVWRQLAWSYVAGVVIVAPLFITLAAALRAPPPRRELIEGAAVLILHALLSAHAFAHVGIDAGHWLVLAPGFSQFPLLLWLSIRCGPLYAAAGSLTLGLVMLGSFAFERGRFGDVDFTTDERALATHFGIVVAAFAALAIAALIAERKRAEAAARRGEITQRKIAEETTALLSAIVTSSSDAIVSITVDGTITSWNAGAERLFGFTAAEMAGQSVRRLIPADRVGEEDGILARILAGEIIEPFETKRLRKDGHTVEVSLTVSPVRDGAGRVIGASKIVRDITERKRAEEALRDSHARLERVLEVETVGVMFWDLTTGRMTDANDTFLKMMGYSRREVEAGELTWQKLTPPEYVEASLAEIRKFQACGRIGPYEKEYLRKDGGRQWLIFAGSSLGANACVEFCVDISGQKQAEAALRDSERRFRQVAESLPQLIWTCAADGSCDYLSPQWVLYTGESEAKQLGHGWLEQLHPDDRKRVMAQWSAALAGGGHFDTEYRIRRHDGIYRWFRTLAVPLRDEAGHVVKWFGSNTDIDDVKQAENKLRESEERLRTIVNTAAEAIVVVDELGRIESVNPATAHIFGYAPAEMVGRDISMLMPEPHRSAHGGYIRSFLDADAAKIADFNREVEGQRKDGSRFTVELSVVEWRRESRRYFTGIMRDISERKQREEQVKLLMKEVNHRAKNMLSVVQAIAAQTAASGGDTFVERFTERLQALATNQDLLVKSQWRGVELADLVRSQLAHFEELIGSRVTVEGRPLRISAKAAQTIGMALHELATNAGKYGALSNDVGGVRIAWARSSDDAGKERFRLSWSERDGPEVRAPSRRGFGTTVIRDMPKMQLAAEVTLEYAPGGLAWSVVCLTESVLEDGSGEAAAMESVA